MPPEGGASDAAGFMDVIYEELRGVAMAYFRRQPPAQTLQPTALVHEAFLRVTDRTGAEFNDRAHFQAVCAVAMRAILADHARRRHAAKRGGDWERVTLADVETPFGSDPIDAIALDDALTELAARSERQARIVEYRFFGGLTEGDIARLLDVSRSTVQEDWRMARAWLTLQLRAGDAP